MKKKILVVVAVIAILLRSSTNQEQGKAKYDYEIEFQKSFTVGGYTVSADNGLYEHLTDTELTNAIEKLLYEKYGEKFICEQYIFYDETALNIDYKAYPENNKDLQFELNVTGQDKLSIQWDKYYNEFYKEQITDYVYGNLDKYGVKRENFFVINHYEITSPDINADTFKEQSVSIYLAVANEEEANELNAVINEIIKDIYQAVQSAGGFRMDVCTEDIKNQGFTRVGQTYYYYDVEYCGDKLQVSHGEPGEFWYVDLN